MFLSIKKCSFFLLFLIPVLFFGQKYEVIDQTDAGLTIVRLNNKYGIIDSQKKEIIPLKYDYIEYHRLSSGFIIRQGQKYGYLDQFALEIISPSYENIHIPNKKNVSLFLIRENGKWEIFNSNTKKTSFTPYKNLVFFEYTYGLLGFQGDTNLWGIANLSGEEIIPAKYELIEDFEDNYLTKVRVNNKWGIINRKGEEVISPEYDYIADIYYHGYKKNSLSVKKNGKWGKITIENDNDDSDDNYDSRYSLQKKPVKLKISVPTEYQEVTSNYSYFSVKKDTKYGFYKNGQLFTPIKYENYTFLNTDIIAVKENGKWGVLNTSGIEIIPPTYDLITTQPDNYNGNNNYFITKFNNKTGIINEKGKEIIPAEFDEIKEKYGEFFIKKNNLWGIASSSGKIIIPTSYNYIEGLLSGYLVKNKTKAGILDNKGKEIIPVQYDRISSLSNLSFGAFLSYFKLEYEGKIGISNTLGKIIIPVKYDQIDLEYNKFIVTQDNKMGLIDSTGKELIPINYQSIESLYNGYLQAKSDNKWALLNKSGKIITPFKYDKFDDVYSPNTSFFIARITDKWGVLNSDGKEILPFIYDGFNDYFEDPELFVARFKDKYGLIDQKGNKITPYKYDRIFSTYKKDYFKITVDGKVGYIDRKGNEFIPPVYDRISSIMNSSLFEAWVDDNSFILNQEGKTIFSGSLEEIEPFDLSQTDKIILQVTKENLSGLIDENGKILVPIEYTKISEWGKNLILLEKDNHLGFADHNGKILIPVKYDANDFHDTNGFHTQGYPYLTVSINGKYGIIDTTTGKEIIPLQYERIKNEGGSTLAARKNTGWGIIDLKNNILLPFQYEGIRYWGKEYITIEKDGKYGLINYKQEEILPAKYLNFFSLRDNDIIYVQTDEKWGKFNIKNQTYTPLPYNIAINWPISDKYILIESNKKYGIATEDDQIIIPPKYDEIENILVNEKYFVVRKEDKLGLTDLSGKEIIPALYTNFALIKDENMEIIGYITKKDEKYGAIDISNKILLPFIYDELEKYSSKIFYGELNEKPGFIYLDTQKFIPEEQAEVSLSEDYISHAEYLGGEKELFKFIEKHLQYPEGLTYTEPEEVVVSFKIEPDGILSGFDKEDYYAPEELYKEAVRVLKLTSGKWIPAKTQDGKTAIERISIPVIFNQTKKK